MAGGRNALDTLFDLRLHERVGVLLNRSSNSSSNSFSIASLPFAFAFALTEERTDGTRYGVDPAIASAMSQKRVHCKSVIPHSVKRVHCKQVGDSTHKSVSIAIGDSLLIS